jgi:phosphopentomutase
MNGRAITRPSPRRRTANRRDFAIPPAGETLLDRLKAAGFAVTAIGKIEDLFAGQGVTAAVHTKSDDEGMDEVRRAIREVEGGLVFANLVDFDTLYGHRNDVAGYAANLERFDARLAALLPELGRDDLLILTADHGNDPTTPSTDHSREYVPLLAVGHPVRAGVDLGTRRTYADLAATLADAFGVEGFAGATSFLDQLLGRRP